MERTFILSWALILCVTAAPVRGQYYTTKGVPRSAPLEKITNLHFFFHDTLSGNNPSAVRVAKPNATKESNPIAPFGSVFAVNDLLTVGPDPKSEVVGNAQGLYVASGQGADMSIVVYLDFGFISGEFNGSSVSLFSRNTVMSAEREVAVVGGRGKFRMARGFAQLKTYSANMNTGDAVVEYHMTVFHS